jgi:hypothetical protein
MEDKQNLYIYVIELEDGKYYVGKTYDVKKRFQEHFEGGESSAAWTRLHNPRRIIRVINSREMFDEEKYTLQYMAKYGVENVRGGSYCMVNLPKEQVEAAQNIIRNELDQCYICYQKGHFSKDCKFKADFHDTKYREGYCRGDGHCLQTVEYMKKAGVEWQMQKLICEHNCVPQPCKNYKECGTLLPMHLLFVHDGFCPECNRLDKVFESMKISNNNNQESPQTFYCKRCLRDSHPTDKCFALKDIKGKDLEKKEAKEKKQLLFNVVAENTPTNLNCERCGRNNHNIKGCYAATHIKGYKI